MAKLHEWTTLVRSKNAGPFELTIDIMFDSAEHYRRTVESGILRPVMVAPYMKVPAADIRYYEYEPAYSIKLTMPRWVASGDLLDSDILGGQQYAPLVELEIPEKSE
jgi:hypothetical protein